MLFQFDPSQYTGAPVESVATDDFVVHVLPTVCVELKMMGVFIVLSSGLDVTESLYSVADW
jgi:hypothetical protein